MHAKFGAVLVCPCGMRRVSAGQGRVRARARLPLCAPGAALSVSGSARGGPSAAGGGRASGELERRAAVRRGGRAKDVLQGERHGRGGRTPLCGTQPSSAPVLRTFSGGRVNPAGRLGLLPW